MTCFDHRRADPWLAVALLTAILVLFVAPVGAQSPVEDAPLAPLSIRKAPVVVDGERLFYVAGTSTFPAKRRAQEVAERIRDLAEDPDFDPKTVTVKDKDDLTEILVGDRRVIGVIDADAELEGVSRDIVVRVFVTRISEAIEKYRVDRTIGALLINAVRAVVWTLVLLAALLAVNWTFRRADAYLKERLHHRIELLETRSLQVLRAEQIWELVRGALRVTRIVLVLFLVYVFLNYVLTLFPWTRELAYLLLEYVLGPIRTIVAAIVDYIPSLIFLVFLVLIARYMLKLLRAFFDALSVDRFSIQGFEREWAIPTYRLVRLTVIILTIVLAYPYIPGSDSAAFKGVTIFLGVLVSLGSTSAIANIVAGHTMTYRRAFRVGDRIRVGDIEGQVTEIRLLVTHVCSLKNEEVIVPNSTILNTEIINYSTMARQEGIILHPRVGIGYEVPWRQVEALLIMAAERTAGVVSEPKPFVLQVALGDYAVTYELNAHCKDEKRMQVVCSDLYKNIQDVFNEYGVQIMTPSYEADPPEAKLVPKEKWYEAPAEPPGV